MRRPVIATAALAVASPVEPARAVDGVQRALEGAGAELLPGGARPREQPAEARVS